MNYSDFVVYVDESGDHGMESLDAEYPIFSLAFCIFRKSDYSDIAAPLLQRFKFKWFGHDMVVLHEHHIRRKKYPFAFLAYDDIRAKFLQELADIIDSTPMTIIAAVIRKDALRKRYTRPENPYQLALLFCLERANEMLIAAGQAARDLRGTKPSREGWGWQGGSSA